MAILFNVWTSFYNERVIKLADQFDVLQALSVYERIDDGSNQNMEGGNHGLNDTHQIASRGGKKSLTTWIEGCRLIEKQFHDREANLKTGATTKKKNKKLRKRDRAFVTARNKHKK